MYTRAWECQDEKPNFNDNQDEPDLPVLPEITVESHLGHNKVTTIADTIPENLLGNFPQVDGIHDGTAQIHDTSYTWDANLEHHNPNSTNPRSSNWDLHRNPLPNLEDEYRD